MKESSRKKKERKREGERKGGIVYQKTIKKKLKLKKLN